jgi:hypothetical protein
VWAATRLSAVVFPERGCILLAVLCCPPHPLMRDRIKQSLQHVTDRAGGAYRLEALPDCPVPSRWSAVGNESMEPESYRA